MQESMINLAEIYEKVGEKKKADELFAEFFKALDGREELKSSKCGSSIKSRISKALSIKSSKVTSVIYRRA